MSGRMSERNSEFKIYLERVLIVFDCVACGAHKPSTDMRIMQSIFAKDIEDKKYSVQHWCIQRREVSLAQTYELSEKLDTMLGVTSLEAETKNARHVV